MLVPFFQQTYADFQYLKQHVCGTGQVDESSLNEDSKGIKKTKFDKLEFTNTCFRMTTVVVMAYCIYCYINTIIKLIRLPLIMAANFLAFEAYLFSKAYTFKKISFSEHKENRIQFWQNFLKDDRVMFIKLMFNFLKLSNSQYFSDSKDNVNNEMVQHDVLD